MLTEQQGLQLTGAWKGFKKLFTKKKKVKEYTIHQAAIDAINTPSRSSFESLADAPPPYSAINNSGYLSRQPLGENSPSLRSGDQTPIIQSPEGLPARLLSGSADYAGRPTAAARQFKDTQLGFETMASNLSSSQSLSASSRQALQEFTTKNRIAEVNKLGERVELTPGQYRNYADIMNEPFEQDHAVLWNAYFGPRPSEEVVFPHGDLYIRGIVLSANEANATVLSRNGDQFEILDIQTGKLHIRNDGAKTLDVQLNLELAQREDQALRWLGEYSNLRSNQFSNEVFNFNTQFRVSNLDEMHNNINIDLAKNWKNFEMRPPAPRQGDFGKEVAVLRTGGHYQRGIYISSQNGSHQIIVRGLDGKATIKPAHPSQVRHIPVESYKLGIRPNTQ